MAVLVGFNHHAQMLEKMMNETSDAWRMRRFPSTRAGILRACAALKGADALISFGEPLPHAALHFVARCLGIPVVIIWVGSDVLAVMRDAALLDTIKVRDYSHFAVAPWLVNELKELGISPQYMPVYGLSVPGVLPNLPEEFSVLTYLPQPRPDFYGKEHVYEIARGLSEVPFVVVGAGSPDVHAPRNVQFMGHREDMPEVLRRSAVLLRLPEHDGQATMVLDALAEGRHVIWIHSAPGVRSVKNLGEANGAVHQLYGQHRSGTLSLNWTGHNYVSEQFDRSKVVAQLEQRLGEVRQRFQEDHAARKRKVSISGGHAESIAVALLVNTLDTQWSCELLEVTSRSNLLAAVMHLGTSDVWYRIGSSRDNLWLQLAALIMSKPCVIHWTEKSIGSMKASRYKRLRLNSDKVTNFAENERVQRELALCNIRAEIAPLPVLGRLEDWKENFHYRLQLRRIITAWDRLVTPGEDVGPSKSR